MDLKTIPFLGASDNYTEGRNGQQVSALVIHVMAGSMAGTRAHFNTRSTDVSAHYGIGEDGQVVEYVHPDNTAWHSGSWAWNLKSVGLEHEGRPPGWEPSSAQLAASVGLAVALCLKYGITPSAATLIPHVRINPKHACPSTGFPLNSYIQRVQDGVRQADQPVEVVPETGHRTELEYALYEPDNRLVGTVTVIKGSDKAYLKTLTTRAAVRAGRPASESFGAVRLFDPQTQQQVGTLSLVLSGPRKAYLNGVLSDLLPR